MSDIFFGIAWYYGNNDFIIRTFDLTVRSDAAHATCGTWYGFSRDLQYLIRILVWLIVKKKQLFKNCMQLQGFPIDSHTLAWVRHMINGIIIQKCIGVNGEALQVHAVNINLYHKRVWVNTTICSEYSNQSTRRFYFTCWWDRGYLHACCCNHVWVQQGYLSSREYVMLACGN